MAKKIGIYGLATAVKIVVAYANRNKQRIIEFGGLPLWSLVELLLGIAGILLDVLRSGENAEGDWLAPLTALNSTQINAVHGAIAQFDAANGIGGGD